MTLRPYSAELQSSFRSILGTPGAPEVIDDAEPVQPVAIVAGNLNASVSTSFSIPSGATPFGYSGNIAASTNTLRTAAAGKKLYIQSVSGSATMTGSGGAKVSLTMLGGDVNILDWESGGAVTTGIAQSLGPSPNLASDTAGALKVTAAATVTLYYCIWGYEL